MTSTSVLKLAVSNNDFDVKSIESAIRASGLATSTMDQLNAQFNNVTGWTLGAIGWHGPTDIQTLVGLEGTFFWNEKPFVIENITFEFDADKVGFQGQYKIRSAWGVVVEEGTFHSVPNNPAIGWAFISLVPTTPNQSTRGFIISGMITDASWKIYVLTLSHVGQSGPILPIFSAVRLI